MSTQERLVEQSLKSCRGSIGDGRCLFFIHPPNDFKEDKVINKLSLVSDILSGAACRGEKKVAWQQQLDQVDLQSSGSEWLQERNESIVIAIDLSNMSYGSAMQSFDSLSRTRSLKLFQSCGVVMFSNGSNNCEDIISIIFKKGRNMFGDEQLSTIAWSKQLSTPDMHRVVRSMCTNSNSLVFISLGSDSFNMHGTVCLAPESVLQYCSDCDGYYDSAVCINCFGDISYSEFDCIPCTNLPCSFCSMNAQGENVQLKNTKLFVSKATKEGKLDIEISVLVSSLEKIKGASDVCVRIHSECLTGGTYKYISCEFSFLKLSSYLLASL